MKTNELKSLLKKEIDDINSLPMSEKLTNTKIQRKSTVLESFEPEAQSANKHSFSKLKIILSSFCLILAVCLSLVFLIPTNKSTYSNLTSYIIDIDPTICVTATDSNEVVSVFSLNNNGDLLLDAIDEAELTNKNLDQCVNKIVETAISKGYINKFNPRPIDISVVNNQNDYSKEKCKYIKSIFEEHLEENDMPNFEINPLPMDLKNFKNRLGFENDFKDLDKMEFDLKNRRRFFNPNHTPAFFKLY